MELNDMIFRKLIGRLIRKALQNSGDFGSMQVDIEELKALRKTEGDEKYILLNANVTLKVKQSELLDYIDRKI